MAGREAKICLAALLIRGSAFMLISGACEGGEAPWTLMRHKSALSNLY